jgi:hypothetical protein
MLAKIPELPGKSEQPRSEPPLRHLSERCAILAGWDKGNTFVECK